MGRLRFVQPETDRLALSDGDWIEVKRELNTGEMRALEGSAFTRVSQKGDDLGIDWAAFSLRKLGVWIVDWSFRDVDDKPVKVTLASIAALDQETSEEIERAIDQHVAAQAEAKKALQTAKTSSGAT